MKKILSEYINKMNTGLFLLDAPTGFGKTKTVIEYIKDFLTNDNKNIDRIFFVTNLKKNLPISNFIDTEFEKYCLYLKPNYLNIIDEWKNIVINDIKITKSEEFKNIDNAINAIKSIKNDIDKKFLKSLEETIEKSYEPKFRELIKKTYFFNKTTTEKIKNMNKYNWIKKLYPIIEIEKYKVIFLTTNKFISPVDPLYKLPYYFYLDKIIEKSIIFIDEFDATKNVILDTIINEGIKSKIDILKLFIHIYYSLINNEIPSVIRNLDKSSIEDENLYYSAAEILDKNRKVFAKIYNKYQLNYSIKTEDINDDKSFIFNDGNYISITKNNQKKYLTSYIDDVELLRKVYTSTKDENVLAQEIIKDIEYSINYFINGISCIAKYYEIYKNKINQKDMNSNYMTFEESIKSCLSLFNLDDKEMNYLYETVKLNGYMGDNIWINNKDNEANFIKTGLEIIEIEDSDYHNLQSVFHKFKFKITPEELILIIAKKTIVIGISATASLNTIIANYDLNYFKNKLVDQYYELDVNNFNRMKRDFLETQKVYNKVNIEVDVVDNCSVSDPKNICKELVKKIIVKDKRKEYFGRLDGYKESQVYYYSILLKIGCAYKKFVENSNMYSFVCFLNSMPLDYDTENSISKKDIEKLFLDISNIECYISYVSSSNFDMEMEKVYNYLSKNQKCFLITTYQTLGNGKNIQYNIPKGIESNVNIVDNYRNEKDFDGILLITPTFLLQNLDYNSKNKYFDISKFIFQQEYLYKKHKNYGVLVKNIIFGFKKIFFNNSFSPIDYKNPDLYMNNARIIIQAVGRICRSPNKNKKILICSESEVIERLQFVADELKERLLNKEFLSILEVKLFEHKMDVAKYNLVNTAANKSIDWKAWTIRSSKEKIEEWKKIRDLVLKNPTYSGSIKELDMYYFSFTTPINAYSYNIKGRLITNISFYPREQYKQVSIHAAGLERLLTIKCIEKLFERNGYSKNFAKKYKIMTPSIFSKIYLGALGEVCGKAILEEYLNIKLEEIKDFTFYELFDYRIGNTFIDFKNWNNFITDNEKYVKKIIRKLQRVNGARAIIINIIKRGDLKKYIMNLPNNVIQIPWIIDFENKVDYNQIRIINSFIK